VTGGREVNGHGGFTLLFSGSATPMMLCDDDRRYTDANEAALELMRIDLASLRAMRIDDITPPELASSVEAIWTHFLRIGTLTGQYELQRADGTRVSVEYNATANVAPGQHLSIFIHQSESQGLPSRVVDEAHERGRLTRRESEVLRLVAFGRSGPEIAGELGISHETVRVHVRNAMRKLGARTRAQAIGMAIAAGEI
jgi:DNA-binding CsgD family transcriptional regulator